MSIMPAKPVEAGAEAATAVAHRNSPPPRRRGMLLVSLSLVAVVVLLDQLSKLWVRTHLLPWESLPAEGFFRITYVYNTGSAFGLFANQTILLTIVSIVAICALLLFIRYQPLRSAWGSLAVGLLLGGSIGNLIDRISLGHVTDFIDIGLVNGYRFFTFNVADSAITVGAVLLAFVLLTMSKRTGNTTTSERA